MLSSKSGTKRQHGDLIGNFIVCVLRTQMKSRWVVKRNQRSINANHVNDVAERMPGNWDEVNWQLNQVNNKLKAAKQLAAKEARGIGKGKAKAKAKGTEDDDDKTKHWQLQNSFSANGKKARKDKRHPVEVQLSEPWAVIKQGKEGKEEIEGGEYRLKRSLIANVKQWQCNVAQCTLCISTLIQLSLIDINLQQLLREEEKEGERHGDRQRGRVVIPTGQWLSNIRYKKGKQITPCPLCKLKCNWHFLWFSREHFRLPNAQQ